jgi:hypothetical protein
VRFQSPCDVGAALVGSELHGYGQEYLTNYPVALAKVDSTSAKQVAGDVLDPKNFVIVMVGDAKDLEPQLKKEGWRFEKAAFSDPIGPLAKEPEIPIDAKTLTVIRKIVDDAVVAKAAWRSSPRSRHPHGRDRHDRDPGPHIGRRRPRIRDRQIRIDATLNLPGPNGSTRKRS